MGGGDPFCDRMATSAVAALERERPKLRLSRADWACLEAKLAVRIRYELSYLFADEDVKNAMIVAIDRHNTRMKDRAELVKFSRQQNAVWEAAEPRPKGKTNGPPGTNITQSTTSHQET